MNNDTPLTVGVLCYNGKRFLDDCLKSLLDQDFAGRYEILLLDNASTDGSADYVRQCYPQVRVVRIEPPNRGFTGAVNAVMAASRSRYFCAVNVDTVFHRHWLSALLEAMQSNPRARMAQSNAIFPWWREFAGQERERLIDRAYLCDVTALGIHDYRVLSLTPHSPPIPTLGGNGAALMFDRAVMDQLGYLMDEDFYCYAEDLDTALRINALGYQVLFVPQAIVYHNSAWQAALNRRTFDKALLSTRNTFLTFFKLSHAFEFAALLPLLFVGNLYKARQHALSPSRQWLYMLAAIPQTLVGFAAALPLLPAMLGKRRWVLSTRVGDDWWLLRRMLGQGWRLDPEVWNALPARQLQAGETG